MHYILCGVLLFITGNVLATTSIQPIVMCEALKGLQLLNQNAFNKIQQILTACDEVAPADPQALLLHGLVARKNKQLSVAIVWLEKAKALAPKGDLTPSLELAVTYEWDKQPEKAAEIYRHVLLTQADNRAALLGTARVLVMQLQFKAAASIYLSFLQKNPNDIDALLGMGWLKLADKQLPDAQAYFDKILKLKPQLNDALLGLQQIATIRQQATQPMTCDPEHGLVMLNQPKPEFIKIQQLLNECDKSGVSTTNVLLLHGLLARKQALESRAFNPAIDWLKKAEISAAAGNNNPALELAVTYEWAKAPQQAADIYQQLLLKDPNLKPAQLGLARALREQSKFQQSIAIYQALLQKNASDVDALSGLGWVELANKHGDEAKIYFDKVLKIDPNMHDALLGLKNIAALKQVAVVKQPEKPKPLCLADQGLMMLNQTNPPLNQINQILKQCDRNTPNATTALLLHGLLARREALVSKHYEAAITWLEKASAAAPPQDFTPLLELAVTYEWSENAAKAALIYQSILFKQPHNRAALLGQARVLRMQYKLNKSFAIYQQLLQKNPRDVDAINGLGWDQMANYQLSASKFSFDNALHIQPGNKEAITGLNTLSDATKYILSVTEGYYAVSPENSKGTHVYFFDNLNATDGLTLFATHNTKEIGSEFFTTPTLMPSNSVLVGFQRKIPNEFGWGISYDYRERKTLPLENRFQGDADYYFTKNLQWFGGARAGTPSPWKNQLYFSGLTLFTDIPVNFTTTGYWANDQIGGKSSSYSFDLSKEYDSHLFYDLGTAYSPTLRNWEIHGRLILPTVKNQAIVADFSHYYFNNSTFANMGWRIYW